MRYADLGSISSGTMICDDVFDACIYTLAQLNKKRARQIQREYDNVARDCPDSAAHDDDRDCMNCLEAREAILNETLWNALNDYAPPYSYFGAHPGDGADYGFWVSDDAIADDVHSGEILKVDDLSEIPARHRGYVLHVNDHGNMTLYVRNARGKLREVWGIV